MADQQATHCCPPGSLGPGGPSDYKTVGAIETVKGHDIYVVGKGDVAVMILPDIWGWNSGRTRLVADEFAAEGYLVVVPRSFKVPLKGGTDGDGLYPAFTFDANGAEFLPWLKEASSVEHTTEMINNTVAFVKSRGATKIGVVGCCWGAWAGTLASTLHPEIVAGVGFHPSIGVEAKVTDGSPVELVKRSQCPWYYMPAGNDADEDYGEEGSFTQALISKFGKDKVKTKRFESMKHGWVPRGDHTNADVAAAQKLAMDEAKSYFKAML